MARAATKQPRRRGKGRPFAKGQSGNPKGLPEWVREIREACAMRSPEALAVTVDLMQTAGDERVRLAASLAILDRAGIKPFSAEPEKIEVTGANGAPLIAGPDNARIDAALAVVAALEVELLRARRAADGGKGDALAGEATAQPTVSDPAAG